MNKFKILSSLAIFAATFTLFACSNSGDEPENDNGAKLACEVNESGVRMCFAFPNDWEDINAETCDELDGEILTKCPEGAGKTCPIDFSKHIDEIDEGVVTIHLYGAASLVSCEYIENEIF